MFPKSTFIDSKVMSGPVTFGAVTTGAVVLAGAFFVAFFVL